MPSIDIEKIKGDETLRNDFISDYKPFIANCVYSITNRRVQYGVDEELSIALIAFNHAIDRFDGRGSFLSFSKLVIKNRLYDYYRSTGRHSGNEPLYNEDDSENGSVVERAIDKYHSGDENEELKEEIIDFSKSLAEVGIEFTDLVRISPKHKAKRKKLAAIAEFIMTDETANKFFHASKNIPLKLIEEKLQISRKNIEPYRKYLIAMIIVANSDFYYLKEYLSL